MDRPEPRHTDDESRIITSEHAPEASGVIGKTSAERQAELQVKIPKSEKYRDKLRKDGETKLQELEAMEQEHDKELIKLTQLHIDGHLSAEALEGQSASLKKSEEDLKYFMNRDFKEADELEKEIDAMKKEVGKDTN